MRTYGIPKPGILFCLILVIGLSGITGCSRPVQADALIGNWTLVASGFEPMETVVPNDRFSGWVKFKKDMTYEMQMHEKGRPKATQRAGTFSVNGNILQTVSGAKVSTSRITFQGNYLVTVTRQRQNKQDFYIYYLPETNTEKPDTPAQ